MNTTAVKNTSIDPKTLDKGLADLGTFIHEKTTSSGTRGALMGVLHKVQEIFGYIPVEAMDFVSEKLSIPTAHIYGMATFYNFFSLKPKAKYKIFTCKGTACYVGGGARILAKLKEELGVEEGEMTPDGLFSLDITRCLGCCGLSPVMQINEDVYVRMVPEKVRVILRKYRDAEKKTVKPVKVNGSKRSTAGAKRRPA
ncbi:MAG: NAD(P)H-dependent oxidoreductase subunit E [Chitinivibrionales bacterium]|nr:NAD(P)H-dependent oxidoreductase subunit E [Chitinivibrionales bacterium]